MNFKEWWIFLTSGLAPTDTANVAAILLASKDYEIKSLKEEIERLNNSGS